MMVLTWAVGVVFAGLGLLHVAWAFGGVKGSSMVIPEHEGKPLFRPGPLSSLGVAVLLFAASLLVFQAGGVVPLLVPASIVTFGTWTVAMTMTARAVGEFRYLGLFKRVRGTRFATWDSWLFSPLCLLLGIGSALLASR